MEQNFDRFELAPGSPPLAPFEFVEEALASLLGTAVETSAIRQRVIKGPGGSTLFDSLGAASPVVRWVGASACFAHSPKLTRRVGAASPVVRWVGASACFAHSPKLAWRVGLGRARLLSSRCCAANTGSGHHSLFKGSDPEAFETLASDTQRL